MGKFAVAMSVALLCGAGAGQAPPVRDTVRVGMMSGVPVKWDLDANFNTFLARLEEADAAGAEIFVTPECWLDGYAAPDAASTPEKLREVAQDLATSAYLKRVSDEAKARAMFICFGFTSIEDGKIYNTAGLWDDHGALIGTYHKTHLQTHDLQFSFGQSLPVWPTPWGPVGIMICADRRWPETARTLRLQGARLILNPTYGFHGDKNTAIMRTRAFENQCFIAFTHPQESLVTDPKGDVLAQRTGDEGWVTVTDLDLSQAVWDNHLLDRRPELYAAIAEGVLPANRPDSGDGPALRVAAAQMLSSFDIAANTEKIVAMLHEAHDQGVRMVAFPEMALTGYTKRAEFKEMLDWDAVDAALNAIGDACDTLDLYAMVGAPTRDGDAWFCAAVTFGPDGAIIDAYEKIYLAGEAWARSGRKLTTFMVDDTKCGTFICHDERYGPLVQLRALAGTQVFFYISCESGLQDPHKFGPYRAQVQARAVENRVYVVHANTPAATADVECADTSHGESRIVAPDGNIIAEAPMYGEQLLIADLNLDRVKNPGMDKALTDGPLAAWMRDGLELVEK